MDVNSIKTKNNFHNYVTIKQTDNTSPIELLICGADGSIKNDLNLNCEIIVFDKNEKVVRQKSTGIIINGTLSFKIQNDLKVGTHELEIITADGIKYPSDSNFYINVTNSLIKEELSVIENLTRDEAINKLTSSLVDGYIENKFSALSSEQQQNLELITARLGFANLSETLKTIRDTILQNNLVNNVFDSKKEKKCIVSFIADDAPKTDLEKLLPSIKRKQFPVGLGVITKYVGTSDFQRIPLMTWEELKMMESYGCEVLGHTHEHRASTTIPLSDLDIDLKNCADTLYKHGFNSNLLVMPYNDTNSDVKKVVKRYFKGAFARVNDENKQTNSPKIDNHGICRVALGAYYDPVSSEFNNLDTSSLDYYKARVDKAIENKDWLVFVLHTHTVNHPPEQQQHLEDIVDYIRSKGVEILKPSEAFEKYANTLQIDGIDGSRTLVNNIGVAEGTYFGTRIDKTNQHKVTDDITAFELGKITYTPINPTEAKTGGYPNANGGVLTTYCIADGLAYSRQTYEPIIFDTSKGIATKLLYERTYYNGWQNWVQRELSANIVVDVTNGHKASDSIDKFKKGKVTYTPINSSEASTEGYPNNNGGILTTYYIEDGTSYVRQTYEPALIYGGTTVDSPIFRRYLLNNVWTAWVADRFRSAKSISIVGLVAGQTWETGIAISGITDKHTVNVTVDSSTQLPNGIIYDVVNVNTDTIRLRLANISSSNTSPTTIKFLVNATL